PCPKSYLANYPSNFIPHNGVATIDQLINASIDGSLQIGNDIASLGAVYGTVISVSGDLIHMSIGQAPNSAVAPLDPKIPEMVVPGGLDIMHDSFESDVSPTREDKYRRCLNMSLPPFMDLYNRQSGIPDDQVNYNLAILADHRAQRVHDSIMQNALFFLSPFDGLLLTGVTYNFIFTLMAKSECRAPRGQA
ncbi:uncharacterized protein K441DRAFT_736124, partial [Cenococcum geophilum 1.58]|uniref:uncharacterized protein n=1 Tax=Cenococcum geophilum 1.58 TaxID=794803 RepID=UPI00358EA852